MWKEVTVVVIVVLVLCVTSVAPAYWKAKFDIYRVCPMSYGTVLRYIHDTKSALFCSYDCATNDNCRSWLYDPGTRVCSINSRTNEATSFPGSCGSTVVFGKMEKATRRDTWLDNTCSSNSQCHVPDSECDNGACRCMDGYAYMYRTDSCLASCQEYGSTFKEEPYYILFNNHAEFQSSLQTCLDECAYNYPECVFIEYHNNACRITVYTALTLPSAVSYNTEANWLQYARNCY